MFDKLKNFGKKKTVEESEAPVEKPQKKKAAGSSRNLGIVLLIFVLVGAYLKLGTDYFDPPLPQPVPVKKAVVKKKPIQVPKSVVDQKKAQAAKQETAPSINNSVAITSPVKPTVSLATETPTLKKPESQTQPLVKTQAKPDTKTPKTPVETAQSKPKQIEAQATTPPSQPAPQIAKKSSAQKAMNGPYQINAGAYVVKSNAKAAAKKIKSLGYTPEMKTKSQTVKMTRLKVGEYSKGESDSKLKEVARYTSGAFRIQKGSKWAVYAGSYYNLDSARIFSDKLYKKGISTTEEYTKTKLPMTFVTIHGFTSQKEASKIANKLKIKGLETSIGKR